MHFSSPDAHLTYTGLTSSETSMNSNIPVFKAHAYGNDFLLAGDKRARAASAAPDASALARALCQRHTGIGADGLIFYELREHGASMRLFNADGSASELSGSARRAGTESLRGRYGHRRNRCRRKTSRAARA